MTDIVKRLRAAAELDPWYYEVNEAAEEIERLRDALKTFADNVKELNAGIDKNWAETINPLKAENQRLRQLNAELVDALKEAIDPHSIAGSQVWLDKVYDILDKATGT